MNKESYNDNARVTDIIVTANFVGGSVGGEKVEVITVDRYVKKPFPDDPLMYTREYRIEATCVSGSTTEISATAISTIIDPNTGERKSKTYTKRIKCEH